MIYTLTIFFSQDLLIRFTNAIKDETFLLKVKWRVDNESVYQENMNVFKFCPLVRAPRISYFLVKYYYNVCKGPQSCSYNTDATD